MSDERPLLIEITRPKKPIEEHWCEHPACRKWGSFGFQGPYGTAWFCGDHRADGDEIIPRR
jgi:hypothetical protein